MLSWRAKLLPVELSRSGLLTESYTTGISMKANAVPLGGALRLHDATMWQTVCAI